MTGDQAAELAKRIINTMRPTPAAREWLEVLEPLDLDAALRTFREFRDRSEDGLRIATYLAAYARVTDPGYRPRPARAGAASESCEWCRGCGYEPGPEEFETVYGEPHAYATVVPCRCRKLAGDDGRSSSSAGDAPVNGRLWSSPAAAVGDRRTTEDSSHVGRRAEGEVGR